MADTEKNIILNIDLQTGQVNSQLDEIDGKLNSLGDKVNLQSFKSVKSEILAAREEAVRLAIAIEDAQAAGQNVDDLSKRYSEVTGRAAQLKDAVDDVNTSIANANPDNRLQGLVSIAQGAIVAIQGVASAFTLIGVDAETAQVAVAKLQAIIGLTSALSSIDQITKGFRDLTNIINLTAVAQRANNVATAAAVAVQRLFTASVNTTTVAFRALRVAIAATGIGLLVVALTTLIPTILQWVSASKRAEAQAEKEREAIDRLSEAYENENKIIDANNRKRILQLRIQGASEARIREEQYQQALERRNRAIQEENRIISNAAASQEQRNKARQDALNAQNDLELQSLENQLAARDEQRRRLDATEKGITSDRKSQLDQRNADEKAAIQEIKDFTENERRIARERTQSDAQNEIDETNRKYNKIIELARKNKQSIEELERLKAAEIARINREAQLLAQRQEAAILVDTSSKRIEIVGKLLNDLTAQNAIANQGQIANYFEVLQSLLTTNLEFRKNQIRQEAEASIEEIKRLPAKVAAGGGLPALISGAAFKAELIRATQETAALQIQALEAEIQAKRASLGGILFDAAIQFEEAKVREAVDKLNLIIQERTTQTSRFRFIEAQKNYASALLESQKLRDELVKRNTNDLIQNLTSLQTQLKQGLISQQVFIATGIDLQNKSTIENSIIQRKALEREFEIRKQFIDRINKLESGLGSAVAGQRSLTRNLLAGPESRRIFDISLSQNAAYYEALIAQENAAYQLELSRRIKNNQEVESIQKQHAQNLLDIETNYRNNVAIINDAVLQNKLSLVNSVADAIGNLGRLFKQGSKEAKIAAVAEIAINTATGFVQGLDLAQKTARSAPPPAIPFVFAAFYASQVASVLGAAARAKQILAKVDGPQPASENAGSQTPQAINASLFNLPQQVQNVRVTGQPSQVVRAFITNEDLRTAQERQAFLNKLSQF